MRFAVETGGVIAADQGGLDREYLESLFVGLADALSEINQFEADVAINFDTADVDFYVVVEASSARAALELATDVVRQALRRVELKDEPDWHDLHARRADLVPA